MSNLVRRILLVLIGIPAIFAVILLVNMFHFIGINILIILFSGLGAIEFADILSGKLYKVKRPIAFILGSILPAGAYISLFSFPPLALPVFLLFLSLGCILGYEIFNKSEGETKNTIHRIGAYAIILIYPGLFGAAIVYISGLPQAKIMITMFLTMVFANDSFAYLFGMLLGKNNRNIFSVSPKKSVAGFAGALAGTTGTAFVFSAIFPELFPLPVAGPILTAAVIFITATAGDLIESAMKRASDIKDSGSIIPGRGGVLDTIDSILFAAPFFVFIIKFIYYISSGS